MKKFIEEIKQIQVTERIKKLRKQTLEEPRYLTVEQARLITQAYREHASESIPMKRAYALKASMEHLEIRIDEGELIVGNRSKESCGGIVFPEGGIKWLEREIDELETRPQDRFLVRPEDRAYFFDELVPFWEGMTLEDNINQVLPSDIKACEVVGKLNQKDHAQGHICPNVKEWLEKGPAGLLKEVRERRDKAEKNQQEYYQATELVLKGAIHFILRYGELAEKLAAEGPVTEKENYLAISQVCRNLAEHPAGTFREAVQSMWFLIVFLQMESNASSFSPGRADQYLYPYFKKDLDEGRSTLEEMQEILDAVFIKFNQIVYMRNTDGAAFFAGFPIGFNIAVGGKKADGSDAVNELSHMFLHAEEHVQMRQPNLSARVHKGSPDSYLKHVAEVIGLGTGMPQLFNDEAVVPALEKAGYSHEDALNYAIVGCVELSTHGNALGFSDAAMFNMVKALELTLNNGVCMQSGKQLGLRLGTLEDFKTFKELEEAYKKQMHYFMDQMEKGLLIIEEMHKKYMPSAMLSCVIDNCMEKGVDITAGGAVYNKSGIQLIQVANVADSMAALKELIYDKKELTAKELLSALRENYPDERIRQMVLTHAPKYGNDVDWVDELGEKWVECFKERLDTWTNYRGGNYTIGLYTVSAHVPMGIKVAATPDGRRSGEPLADGGLSAVYGRDQKGPTALLRSVSKIKSINAANGTLLNMKFAPQLFEEEDGVEKFCGIIRGFVELKINHVQFNVVNKQDLIAAKETPENYRHLLVRVAGYTANYVDLAEKLQDEIIARTEYGGNA